MREIVAGAMVMMYLVAGLFFLRGWTRTKDVLFVWFTLSFWILAIQQFALALFDTGFEHTDVFYTARLIAFLLILVGIWSKNRSR